MLSNNTIEAVKASDISQVITALSGAKINKNNKCACPIHGEKTASLSIHQNNFFKCFGCGVGGDAIAFAQSFLNTDYIGAIEAIAKALNIPIEYVKKEQTKEEETRWAAIKSRQITLNYAMGFFALNDSTDAIKAKEYLYGRGINADTIAAFKIGYADGGGVILNPEFSQTQFLEAALLREKDGQTFPYFYNRIMLPYFDRRGNCIAFTGREAKNGTIKYLNSPSEIWDKGAALYGLYQSKKSIADKAAAYIVEGQFDCLAMYQKALPVVAASGWALSEHQLELLKKTGAKVLTLCPDNDKAGLESLDLNAAKALAAGFIVKVLFVPDGAKDPAEYLNSIAPDQSQNWLLSELDYMEYKAGQAAGIAESGAAEQANEVANFISIIESIPNALLREAYLDKCKKLFKGLRTYKLKKRVEDANLPIEAVGAGDSPEKGKQGAEYLEFSFYQKGNTLWTYEKKNEVLIANFIIEPLYFVENEEGSQYVCKFTNANGLTKTRAMKATDLTTKNAFTSFASQLGNFIFVGNDTHLGHIKMKILEGVPAASIPKYLGWHTTFKAWIWANGVYLPSQKKFFAPDRWGIVKTPLPIKTEAQLNRIPSESELLIKGQPVIITNIEEFKERNNWAVLLAAGDIAFNKYYYLPFANKYANEEDNTNIGKFKLTGEPSLDFENWAGLMSKVYKEQNNFIPMLSWFCGALFRDILHKEYSWYPMLNFFGPPEKGKSTAARSLAKLFGEGEKDGINIESGSSETGLIRFIATFQNAVIWINEYKNSISDKKRGALKSIADGGGKVVGMNTGGTETKSHSARSAAIISGQELPTGDPALKTRCITLEFAGTMFNPAAYNELRNFEIALGGGHIVNELLQYRRAFETEFKKHEIKASRDLKEVAAKIGIKKLSERLELNNVLIYTPVLVLMEAGVKFPFTWEDCLERAGLSFLLEEEVGNSSNDIEQFFNVISSCIGKTVFEGEHYQIRKDKTGTFLYLRLQQVSGFYREAANRQGVNALDIATLKAYAQRHHTFIEYKAKNVRFDRLASQTSAYIFDYEALRRQGVELYSANDIDLL